MEQIIVGIDPGVTTGLSVIHVPQDQPPQLRLAEQHILNPGELYQLLTTRIDFPATIVCEDFILRRGGPMTSDQIAPTYLIGAVEAWSFVNDYRLELITPSESKRAVKDEHLKNLGLFHEPKTRWDHANDATRLVVAHLKVMRHRPTLVKGFSK